MILTRADYEAVETALKNAHYELSTLNGLYVTDQEDGSEKYELKPEARLGELERAMGVMDKAASKVTLRDMLEGIRDRLELIYAAQELELEIRVGELPKYRDVLNEQIPYTEKYERLLENLKSTHDGVVNRGREI